MPARWQSRCFRKNSRREQEQYSIFSKGLPEKASRKIAIISRLLGWG
jgi:hypothetical protein